MENCRSFFLPLSAALQPIAAAASVVYVERLGIVTVERHACGVQFADDRCQAWVCDALSYHG